MCSHTAAVPCGRPEAAAAAPPPPRPPPAPLPTPPPSPPSLRPPPPPPSPPTAAAALARLLGRRQQSPPRPCAPVHPPAAPARARCCSDPHRPRRSRRAAAARRASSRGTARALSFPVPLTRHVSAALIRLWLRLQRSEGGMAAEKSQNRKWHVAAFSGCAARPIVKLAWRDVLAAACERTSRARSHAALCVWRRRLLPRSYRRELQGARHRLACRRPRRPRRRDRSARHVLRCSVLLTCAVRPCAMALTGSGLRLHAHCYWQLGGRVTSCKIRSGCLPHFQLQLCALLICCFVRCFRFVVFGV